MRQPLDINPLRVFSISAFGGRYMQSIRYILRHERDLYHIEPRLAAYRRCEAVISGSQREHIEKTDRKPCMNVFSYGVFPFLEKSIPFCSTGSSNMSLRGGQSGAPDVAISWYHPSKYTAVSKACTRRLPRRFAPRNDRFGAAQHYRKVYFFVMQNAECRIVVCLRHN